MFAIASYHGGIIIFGVRIDDSGVKISIGLSKFEDKVNVGSEIYKFILLDLDYEILDFVCLDSNIFKRSK